jgi:hypothetical protein
MSATQNDVQDRHIWKPGIPQARHIRSRKEPRTKRELLDKLQHAAILFGQFSRAIVLLDSSSEVSILRGGTQKLCVSGHSIEAVVGAGGDGIDHLPFCPRQGLVTPVDRSADTERQPQSLGLQAV